MNSNTYRPNISFGIVTGGKRKALLEATVQSIKQLKVPEYEILICGNITNPIAGTTSIPYPEPAKEGRIGAMRNRIIDQAQYDIIVMCDDDISFDSNFYQALREYGDNYDVMCPKILNQDGSRYWDWAVFESPTGHHIIPYNKTSEYVYATGGACILKKHVTQKVRWNSDLGFYQNEDTAFSYSLKEAGFMPKCNPQAIVIHHDSSITQMEDFNIRLPSDRWVTHFSGLKLRGANLGDPNSFSISQTFDIEIPNDFFENPILLEATFSLIGSSDSYYPSNPIGEIFANDDKIGEIKLNEQNTSVDLKINFEKADKPTTLTVVSNALTIGAWNFAPRCRNIESFLVQGLKLKDSNGKPICKSDLPERVTETEKKQYKLIKKSGIRVVGSITCGNNESRIVQALLPNLDTNGVEIALEPRICSHEQISELRINSGEWLKYLTNNVQSGTRLEVLDKNRVPFANYHQRQKEIWGDKNIGLSSDSRNEDSDLKAAFDEVLNLMNLESIKYSPYLTPYNLIEQCSKISPLEITQRPKKLYAVEFSPWDDTGIASFLHIVKNYFTNQAETAFIAVSPEPHFWEYQPSLGERIKDTAKHINIDLDTLPNITPMEGSFPDTTLFNTYRAMDAVLYMRELSHPVTFVPAILAKCPIVTSCNVLNLQSLNNLGIEPILTSEVIENDHKSIAERLHGISDSREKYKEIAIETFNIYTNCPAVENLTKEILALHMTQ